MLNVKQPKKKKKEKSQAFKTIKIGKRIHRLSLKEIQVHLVLLDEYDYAGMPKKKKENKTVNRSIDYQKFRMSA